MALVLFNSYFAGDLGPRGAIFNTSTVDQVEAAPDFIFCDDPSTSHETDVSSLATLKLKIERTFYRNLCQKRKFLYVFMISENEMKLEGRCKSN